MIRIRSFDRLGSLTYAFSLGYRIFDAHGYAHNSVPAGSRNDGLRRESSIEVEQRNVPESYGSIDSNGSVIVGEGGVLVSQPWLCKKIILINQII